MLVNNVVLTLGKVVVEEIIDCSNKVRGNLPLDATYVQCRITSILYKIDIYIAIWVNKLFPLRISHN
jgi:hypothetical protein